MTICIGIKRGDLFAHLPRILAITGLHDKDQGGATVDGVAVAKSSRDVDIADKQPLFSCKKYSLPPGKPDKLQVGHVLPDLQDTNFCIRQGETAYLGDLFK